MRVLFGHERYQLLMAEFDAKREMGRAEKIKEKAVEGFIETRDKDAALRLIAANIRLNGVSNELIRLAYLKSEADKTDVK